MIDYHRLKAVDLGRCEQTYGPTDCILYALGVGAGLAAEQGFGDETTFLYEEGIRALPTMAHVLAYPGFWMRDPRHGIDWRKVVHGEQRLVLHAPLPSEGQVYSRTRVAAITDKGEAKGCAILVERRIYAAEGDQLIATIGQVNFCRGDGGYSGGDPALSDPGPAPIPGPPERAPDSTVFVPTARNQAALYRLNGDRNPLHIDRESARAAGLAAPILHGLAQAGLVCRAILRGRAERALPRFDIRFSAPMYPGETLATDLWETGPDLAFRCREALSGRVTSFGTASFEPPVATGEIRDAG